MNKHKLNWLPHLEGAIPSTAYGNKLSMYLIALEAWRRGVTVNFFSIDNPENQNLIRYSLEYNGREYKFESSRGEKLSEEAYKSCENKDVTKKLMSKSGVTVPKGKRFKENISNGEIVNYTKTLGFPVVLKPTDANAGKGVFSNIQSEHDLKESLLYLRDKLGYKDIIVEKYVKGIEYRFLLVQGEVIGAVNRVPANIVGNGKNTIEELISLKNKGKKDNPNLSRKVIKIDREVLNSIDRLGYELDSVPGEGEQIFLRSKSNVSAGGDPIDVTDELSKELIVTASTAANSIRGLDICGLDMIVDEQKSTGTVIEINTKPMLGLHIFPVKGQARDVVKPIIDYYFPETMNAKQTDLYFDLDNIIAPLNNLSTKEVKVLPPPSLEKLHAKSYIVTGNIAGTGYFAWIRKQARKLNLNGFIKKFEHKKVIVVVAGTDKEKLEEFKSLCYQGSEEADVKNIVENEWNKPVKIGFEIQNETKKELRKKISYHRKENSRLKKETKIFKEKTVELQQDNDRKKEKLNKLMKENSNLENEKNIALKEVQYYKKKYDMIKNSRSWRYTRLARKVVAIIKKGR
ncbi:D-alanine-D-alanine ligase [Lentibacillus halodurans]|uniref:Acylphosphatase n=1 Tax=Lentibacillus halodurans TaxID=237679 RepID=A0A1I0ZSN5_9BACI|nr:acylphosphatase [Lentibacillus halodurans]SFB27450.1 D-alanine-D-alanine ligase [Lentibacillus halodurans]